MDNIIHTQRENLLSIKVFLFYFKTLSIRLKVSVLDGKRVYLNLDRKKKTTSVLIGTIFSPESVDFIVKGQVKLPRYNRLKRGPVTV